MMVDRQVLIRDASSATSPSWFGVYGTRLGDRPPLLADGDEVAEPVLQFGCTGCGAVVGYLAAHDPRERDPGLSVIYVIHGRRVLARTAERTEAQSVILLPWLPDDLVLPYGADTDPLALDCFSCGRLAAPELALLLARAREALSRASHQRTKPGRVYLTPLGESLRGLRA